MLLRGQSEEHMRWLSAIDSSRPDLRELIWPAKLVWAFLSQVPGGIIPVPSAATGEDKICYYWDKDNHHLELEFTLGKSYGEWFYRNRKADTESLWSEWDVRQGPPILWVILKFFEMYGDQ